MSKRAIFEDIATGGPDPEARRAPVPGPGPARAGIALWLWVLALLVVAMVLVGGLTRLTDSGLSITVWDPVMGAIPPLSEADWQAAFEAYRATTEFQEQNHWMTLADFKPIFWWEWGHRFLGRLVGVVWLAGFLGFLMARRIPRGWTGRLILPGLLGGLQGVIGWWMVASGLAGRVDVASYRLALHLGLAIVIFMLLIWFARKIRLDEVAALAARRRRLRPLLGLAGALAGLVFLQILLGALVAGIDAGRGFVDWPLMEGQFLPPDMWVLSPGWRNLFENAGTVQFLHRMVGYLTLALALVFALRTGRAGHRATGDLGRWVAVAALGQVLLGIVTVMQAAPIHLASLHQAGALVLVWLLMLAKFEIAYPREERIARG